MRWTPPVCQLGRIRDLQPNWRNAYIALLVFTLFGAAALPLPAGTSYSFSHFVGTPGGPGAADGGPPVARFAYPTGICRDNTGGFYVVDLYNATIRKISATGNVSTFAGRTEEWGHNDGLLTEARFWNPEGIVAGQNGDVYVSDPVDNTIRKLAGGQVSTFAGVLGVSGRNDGPRTTATFDGPAGLTMDSAGNLYVADGRNGVIRKITPDGVVSSRYRATVGNVVSTFTFPPAVCIDNQDNVFVASNGREIWRMPAQGNAVLYCTLDDTAYITGLAFTPAGLLLAVDTSGRIYRIDSAGQGALVAGYYSQAFKDGPGLAARFNLPQAIATDLSGNAYVTDTANYAIRKLDTSFNVSTAWGIPAEMGVLDGAGSAARFNAPWGVVLDRARNLYVSDYLGHTIRKITPTGLVQVFAGKAGESGVTDGIGAAARFKSPAGLAIDRADNLYVCDSLNNTIRKITPDGSVSTLAGSAVSDGNLYNDGTYDVARFNQPFGITVDTVGNIYVADSGNLVVRKLGIDGLVRTVVAPPNSIGALNGAKVANLSFVYDIVVDSQGNLFVADEGNHVIHKVTATGASVFAGSIGVQGSVDGAGSDARFSDPAGLAIDAADVLYVAESGNCTIRMITPAGVVSTIGGKAGHIGSQDGSGEMARFNGPTGLAVDPATGTLYVSDQWNHAIRKGTLSPGSQTTPTITWAVPDPIAAGGALSAIQLNATSSVPGTFTYSPAIGTVLEPGVHTVTVTFTPTDTVNYRVVTASVQITVLGPQVTKMANISTRAYCGTGERVAIGGFVVTGTGKKRVLVRAVGPSLAARGINTSEVLTDPFVEVHHGEPVIASNDNWGDNSNAAEIASLAAQIGAAGLEPTDTKSAALLLSLDPGVYTFVVSGKNNSAGVVLLEVYDADVGSSTSGSSFVNIATRAYSTTGSGVAIGGFVVTGSAPKQMLLRAVGPTLVSHGIAPANTLADPIIELHDANRSNAVIAANDNWGDNVNAAAITATGNRIGAAPFDATDTKSSALLVSLNPGVYTFVASGKNNTSGVVLVEVYDAD